MRTGGVILSVLVLLWGFLQAPFDHIHPDELEHMATSAFGHLHGHEPLSGQGPSIAPRTADDDEIDVVWSVVTSAAVALHADVELDVRVLMPTPSPASVLVSIPQHRGHDPPQFSPAIPRAPPA